MREVPQHGEGGIHTSTACAKLGGAPALVMQYDYEGFTQVARVVARKGLETICGKGYELADEDEAENKSARLSERSPSA